MSIRNFWIIAHIDHGKSTLADRMLEITGTKEKREMKNNQMLDTMEIEQERGITIKLTPVRMEWKWNEINLIDTPGHVDFQYEVSRSLASVEWVVLVVDATQGIEAQTLSNLYMAIENNLVIIPVLNKIDLPSADVPRVTREIVSLIGCDEADIIPVSAKVGTNVDQVLDAIVERIPEPRSVAAGGKIIENNAAWKIPDSVKLGLIFDSQYDSYRGVVIYIKLFSGEIKRGDKITLMSTNTVVDILEVGCFKPEYHPLPSLKSGEIGYIVTWIKTLQEARVWDTIFAGAEEYKRPIPGFQKVTPYVFAGVYPVDTEDYNQLKTDIEKLKMSDSSLTNEHEVSPALGHGFRCGFLGLLHMEIVKERLDREFDLDVILTSPQVTYQVMMPGDHSHEFKNTPLKVEQLGEKTYTRLWIRNPEHLPEPGTYEWIEEPIVKLEIITRSDMVGEMMKLAQEHRGIYKNQAYIDETRSILTYEIPMAEIITDFYDELKSRSSGYASMSYEQLNYKRDDLVKIDILVNNERISAFSTITHRSKSFHVGVELCGKLKEAIPKQLFSIPIQAAIGAKVIARETINAYRKDVTGYLYGGDVTRKNKLLDKQKKGKKKMKEFGKVSIPSETFIDILKKK